MIAPKEIEDQLVLLGAVIGLARKIDCDGIVEVYEHVKAMGPLVESSAWSRNEVDMRRNEEAIRALRDFRNVTDRLYPESLI